MSQQILPHQLADALKLAQQPIGGLKVLSLDCFDTLLWRDTHKPADIFSILPGITALQRVVAEGQARKRAKVSRASNEVSIDEIYAQMQPNASDAERKVAANDELAAEARHCFVFGPSVELMRAAKAAGLTIIIVSDTYLSAKQLRALITNSAGEEVAAMIDRIFCSSEIGKPKAEGMFVPVLKKLKVDPAAVLHIGDNRSADYVAAKEAGIQAVHLQQFSPFAQQRLRLESAMASMTGKGAETVEGAQPHRASLALLEPQLAENTGRFGLAVLGPIFRAFDAWLRAEAAQLQAVNGGTVHWLFLMRDGHLPLEMHRASCASDETPDYAHPVEISRFTATAASLAGPGAINRHIESEFGLNPATLARQMLVPEDVIEKLVDEDMASSSIRLLAELKTGQRRKQIMRDARAFAQRLVAHIRKTVNPAPGDTLMLADLGYNGSVQNRIDHILARELDVKVAGRYLLLREQDRPGLDKSGMIDARSHDPHFLETLCANVAVLEQLCTASMGSVIDYEEDGTPIRRANDIKQQQSDVREQIQRGCLTFAELPSDTASIRVANPDLLAMWSAAATASLARLMYLPLPEELAVVQAFEHDVNLGSERTVSLFEPDIAAKAMRQSGLFYLKGSERMYLPAELVGQGLPARLSHFTQKRFGLGFVFNDFVDREIELPVIFMDGERISQSTVTASATHDGYFVAAIPIGENRFSIAVQFGARFEYVQVDSVSAMPVSKFLTGEAGARKDTTELAPALDGMEQCAPHLFSCEDEAALMLIQPPSEDADEPMMAVIAFRPVVERREVQVSADPVRQLAGVAA